jgi:hypothetical protein
MLSCPPTRHEISAFSAVSRSKNHWTSAANPLNSQHSYEKRQYYNRLEPRIGGFDDFGRDFCAADDFRTRTLRTMQIQATQANTYRMAVESLAQDAIAYSQKNPNPEIQRILQPALAAKPATH